jgi:hypothetical protein
MSIACEYGHLLTIIMLGCRTHGPTANDEVCDGACCACWMRGPDCLLVVDVLMQRRLRRSLAARWSEGVDASLLRRFVEASSL